MNHLASSAIPRTAWRALVFAIGLCGATAAGAVDVTELTWGPRPAPLSWTPFFDAGAFRPQTMIDGLESYSYYDQYDHKFSGSDNVSHYAAGPQATQRGGLYACGPLCEAAAPGADAGYLTGAEAGGPHVAAGAWHLDHHPGDTSTGGSAFASAAVGDMLHLDRAATVHWRSPRRVRLEPGRQWLAGRALTGCSAAASAEEDRRRRSRRPPAFPVRLPPDTIAPPLSRGSA